MQVEGENFTEENMLDVQASRDERFCQAAEGSDLKEEIEKTIKTQIPGVQLRLSKLSAS